MRGRGDRGSLSIEYVIVTPLIFLVFALIYVFGRIAEVNGVLDAGTRDAARVATQADTYQQAKTAALKVVQDEVGNGSTTCLRTLRVDVSQPFEPGQTITVTATCNYPLSDGVVPGVPGSITVSSKFSSMLDPNKSVG